MRSRLWLLAFGARFATCASYLTLIVSARGTANQIAPEFAVLVTLVFLWDFRNARKEPTHGRRA